ncbi:MAG: hypothetical protein H6Q04_1981 [Acidobacteria bacterium]|nr:hypothetical protein [Acidobacteriota bacterium]
MYHLIPPYSSDVLSAFGYESTKEDSKNSNDEQDLALQNHSIPTWEWGKYVEGIMKIGFIKATNEIDVQWFKPLAFGYLKSYLDKNLRTPVTMTLLDTPEELDLLDIVAISSTSQDYAQAIQIARSIKQKNRNTVTILGGHHITYLPETLTEDFDVGVRGEGEQTFLDLINYFQENGFVIMPEKLKKIKGVIFRENGNIIITEKRQLINLDDLPHPDRQSGGLQYIFSSRGCPYKCVFCSSSAFWERTRFFSADYVVEEIEQLMQKFPDMKQIPIWDDLFIADKQRLIKIVDLVEAKGINKKVTFSFSIRANFVDDEMCMVLKRLNVVGVAFGAESGSDRILKLMNKGTTVRQNQKALDLLQAHGIPVMCSFIMGWPTETEEEVCKTFEFILQNIVAGKLPTSNAVNILMPIPGTALWNAAIRDGLIDLDHFDWNRLSTFASYKDTKLKSFDEWVAIRRKTNSIYLNESTFPQERLYERMAEYYRAIETLEKCEPDKRDGLSFKGPETVNLELTLRCNLKCRMCQRSSQGFTLPEVTDMPMAMVEKVLPLLKDAKYIWLSGFGEPLMHEDLVPIIRKIRTVNKTTEIGFTTNFVLMTGRKLIDIIQSGLSLVQVSIDGDNELGHAFSPSQGGVARYQDVLWRNLRAFHATKQDIGVRNPKLQFCFVGMKRNINQLEAIIKRGLEVGLSSIVVQPVRDYHGCLKGEDLFEHRGYALPVLDQAREFAGRNGVEFICRFMDDKMSVTRHQCNFPRVFFHVSVNGDVYMCCEGIAAGQNIETTDPKAIWNSPPYRQLRRELASGKLRKKCWYCPLVQPTTKDESVLYRGLLQLPPPELAKEILIYQKYIDGCHEREQALEKKCTASTPSTDGYTTEINDLKKSLEPFMTYAALIQRVANVETTLSCFTRSAHTPQENGTLLQECIQFFNVLAALINNLQTSTTIFPGLRRIVEEMAKSTAIIEQILQPIALCNDLAKVNQIISEPLIKALAVWPGFFAESRDELNRAIETFAKHFLPREPSLRQIPPRV